MARRKQTSPPSESSTRPCPSSSERVVERWNCHAESVYWSHLDSGCTPITEGASRFACFDLDGTLITTKTQKKFPVNRTDWKYLHATKTKNKLIEVVESGYRVIIFTNQKGISTGLTRLSDICGKLEDLQDELKIPLTAFILTKDDNFRKPLPGGWLLAISEECNFGTYVDTAKSFFVGDAAGRLKTKANLKDFNASDLKFALNTGLRFYTPEMYFFGDDDRKPEVSFSFDPRSLRRTAGAHGLRPISEGVEVVILVGPPGAGKTCLYRKLFFGAGYTHVNQDTEKAKAKCVSMCRTSLARGCSSVIDNQNSSVDTRKAYIDIAKDLGASVRCVYFDVPRDFSFHLNAYRTLTSDSTEHRESKVPVMVIHRFYKHIQPPQLSEGISEIVTINLENFDPGPFPSEQSERLFYSFLN